MEPIEIHNSITRMLEAFWGTLGLLCCTEGMKPAEGSRWLRRTLMLCENSQVYSCPDHLCVPIHFSLSVRFGITQKTFRFNRIPTHNDPYGSRTGTVSVCTENKMCHQKQNRSSQRKHWHWHICIWKSSVGTETNVCVLLFNVIYFQCQTYLIIIWYFFIFMSFFFFDNLKMFPFCHCSDSIEHPIIVTSHLQRANNWDQINDCTQNGWGQRKNEKGWRLNILAFIWMEW